MRENREIPSSSARRKPGRIAQGRATPQAWDERRREVRHRHSTNELAEQGRGGSPAAGPRPTPFDFLGFTHICARRRKDGRFTVWRRHEPVPEQGKWLRAVVQGYFNYHAVPDNMRRLNIFRGQVSRAWLVALRRRSQKGRNLTWAKMNVFVRRWIPPAKQLHPYPNVRLRVSYSR